MKQLKQAPKASAVAPAKQGQTSRPTVNGNANCPSKYQLETNTIKKRQTTIGQRTLQTMLPEVITQEGPEKTSPELHGIKFPAVGVRSEAEAGRCDPGE
jgi:hypothetical protein